MGCAPGDGTEPRVDGVVRAGALVLASPMVEYGTSWLLHRAGADTNARVTASGDAGVFAVPASAGVVTAYLDVNSDGALNPYAEPSTVCERRGGRWECAFDASSITILRVDSGTIERSGDVDFEAPQTTVLFEAYRRNGRPQEDARLCVSGTTDCAVRGAHSLGPAHNPSMAIGPCVLRGAVGAPASSLAFDLTMDSRTERVETATPAPLVANAASSFVDGFVTVDLTLRRPAQRVVGWIGSADATSVRWSTEQRPSFVSLADSSAQVTIPLAALEDCTDCKIMVQAVGIVRTRTGNATLALLSEGRFALEPP